MKLTITGLNINEFRSYLNILPQVATETKQEGLNASLFYHKDTDLLYLVIRDSIAFVKVQIPCAIKNEGVDFDWGLMVNNNTLAYILNAYQDDSKSNSMTWEMGEAETSFFKIITTYDNLSLPNLPMSPDQIVDIREQVMSSIPVEGSKFQLSNLGDSRADFLTGIETCLSFISNDDRKNNAIAFYPDRMMVSNAYHIYLYEYDNMLDFISEDSPLSFHKKIARAIKSLQSTKLISSVFDVIISGDDKLVYLVAPRFEASMNNGIASINPPRKEDLARITPVKKLCTVDTKTLAEAIAFIDGFYRSNIDRRCLAIDVKDSGVMLTFRDNGVAGYNFCNVERLVPTDFAEGYEVSSATVTNECIYSFLLDVMSMYPKDTKDSKEPAEGEGEAEAKTVDRSISISMDSEHIGVYLNGGKRKLFLAKSIHSKQSSSKN